MDIQNIIHKLATDQEVTENELIAILIEITRVQEEKERKQLFARQCMSANLN